MAMVVVALDDFCCLGFVLLLVFINSVSACLSEPLEKKPSIVMCIILCNGRGTDCRFQLQMQHVFVS